MSWLRIDDQFFVHRKVINLSKDAKLLHLAALAYCCSQSPDGLLTPAAVRIAAGNVDAKPVCAKELIEAELWHKEGDNYRIHDFEVYNPPQKRRASNTPDPERSSNAQRQARYREKQKSTLHNENSNGNSNALRNAENNVTEPLRNNASSRTRASARLNPSPSPLPIGGIVVPPIPPPPTPRANPEPVPVPLPRGGGGLEDSDLPLEEVADTLPPEKLLRRFQSERPEHISRLQAALGSAKSPVHSQAVYLRPLIIRILSGKEPEPLSPLNPVSASDARLARQQSPSLIADELDARGFFDDSPGRQKARQLQ